MRAPANTHTIAHRYAAGFTLIELLVTLLLLATLATLSYRSLNVVLSARESVNQQAIKWQQLGAFMNRFKQDVQMAAPYTVRKADIIEPAWVGRAGVDLRQAAAQEQPQLEFSRFASVAGQDRLRRIGYYLNANNELELWLWSGLDRLPGTDAARYVVLPGVNSITFEYMNASLQWVSAWPMTADDADIPRAVRFQLEMLDGDVLTRVFSLST